MRFVQFVVKSDYRQRLGIQLSADGDVINLNATDPSIPNSLIEFLKDHDYVMEKVKRIVAVGKDIIPLNNVNILAPITKPDKVICVGYNYSGHCDEESVPYPKQPTIFSKFSSCIVGPYDNVEHPKISTQLDWEVEMAVVIGKKAKAISPDEAGQYIFGYTVAQDITARDWQREKNNGQFLLGKSMDTFCPLGPAVVTREAIKDVNNLNIRSMVNGQLKQNGNTSEMIFKIDFLVSYISQAVTLYPGDVILTGTPAGVGVHRNPPEFLKLGDVVESEIAGIGKLRNTII